MFLVVTPYLDSLKIEGIEGNRLLRVGGNSSKSGDDRIG